MIFGGYDESKFKGELQWFPLKVNSWWGIDLRQMKYGDTVLA